MMDNTLLNEPISTLTPAFFAMVDEHLARNEFLVILIRYANCGGAKDYLTIRTRDEFDTLLKKLVPKTSITVFFESTFALKGKVNAELLKKVDVLFAKEYDDYEGLVIICLEPQNEDDDERNILFMQDLESINEWLRLHKDYRVLIGTMKFWHDNNKDFVTAYVPDNDGQIRPGAY